MTWDIDDKSIVKKNLKRELNGKNAESFSLFFKAYLERLKADNKYGTLDKANATYSKLHKFVKTDNILFKEIDVDFLKGFEDHLRKKLKNRINTIHSNLKMLRKLFNDAYREELISFESNPFPKYPLKTEKGKKEYLTEEELERIENLIFNNNSKLEVYRDLFVFSCNTGGIRISDLLQLKWKNFDGTHINFIQQKTNEINNIKVPNKALFIIVCYKSITGTAEENYIFPFLKEDMKGEVLFNYISSKTAYINKNLKKK